MELLIIKTGALGDVLRTTSILPGLHEASPGLRVTWLTAARARELVGGHPLVHAVCAVEPDDDEDVARAGRELAREHWDRVLSLDDSESLCALATAVAGEGGEGRVSGAFLDRSGQRRYTRDVGPWFDMGLLSIHGKEEADRRKLANRESHPALFARMLGIAMGRPELPLDEEALAFARAHAAFAGGGPSIGINTGAGSRWESKSLPVGRTAELIRELARRLAGEPTFLLLGGPQEAGRNAAIADAVGDRARVLDLGTEHPIPRFAALVDRLDLLLTSDSLALHVAIARRVPCVAFFAPTSAAEIELYGRGEKVQSLAPDYCSYRSDADTSTLTVERLADAVQRVLAAHVRRER